MRAHVIEDSKIVNTIEVDRLDALPGIVLVDAEQGGTIGDDYVDGKIIPNVPVSSPREQRMTVLAFRNRFTRSEKVRIELASIDDLSADQAERERAAIVRIGQADLAAATYVDVEREETRIDVFAFEAMGLLDAPGRALTILNEPIQPHELL